jgi:hypothetical protein
MKISRKSIMYNARRNTFAPASNLNYLMKSLNRFLEKPFKRPDSDFTKW